MVTVDEDEGIALLDNEGLPTERESDGDDGEESLSLETKPLPPTPRKKPLADWIETKRVALRELWETRRILYHVQMAIVVWVMAVSIFVVAKETTSSRGWISSSLATHLRESPFGGAFARFPRLSELPEKHRRITMVGAWNGNSWPSYLRHFFYTVQLNADYVDLVMINRLPTENDTCLDFEAAKVDINWGGNVKVYCMNDTEWKRRHVDFLCSSAHGWDCNATEYEAVTHEYQQRADAKNYNWRPLRGYVFQDLFPHPENPFWAWVDHDLLLGNFAHYPFNLLSQLSILSGSYKSPDYIFMAGQLTAFNLEDPNLGSAWKKFPGMKSPAHFTNNLEGGMPESSEERYWSYGYLRSDDDLPGTDLSWAIYPDLHGDDYYNGQWQLLNSSQIYVVSGRDMLLVSSSYSRKQIEDLMHLERSSVVDDLGGVGWTGGEDGSQYLINQPDLTAAEAKLLAMNQKSMTRADMHDGIVQSIPMRKDCTANPYWKQCVNSHPLELTTPAVMRTSLVHFREQRPNYILRRLERDHRPRGYERKLIKHHIMSKALPWFELPPFDITEDLVLRYNHDLIEVFKMGETRDKTLFYRSPADIPAGNTSAAVRRSLADEDRWVEVNFD